MTGSPAVVSARMVASGALAVLVLLGSASAIADARVPRGARKARVTHVSDGDTAYLKPLRFGEKAASWPGRKARFIGVDTPETFVSPPECLGEKASAFTRKRLEGKRVKVTYGKDPLDHYGRALIYVWVKGKLFNRLLVAKGFARVETYPPNDRYEATLEKAERRARERGKGLWGEC